MPFREVSRMEKRLDFVTLASVEGANMRGLCRRFAISPTTSYKWLARWRQTGDAGLAELSLRAAHPAWGGRKIARRLKDLGHDPVRRPRP